MLNILEKSILFKEIDSIHLQKITEFCQQVKLKPGEHLFAKEKEFQGSDLFLLVSGRLDVVVLYPGKKQDREIFLGPVDHEVFGEVAWCLRSKRTAVIRCQKSAQVIRINGKLLDDYFDAHPDVGYVVTKRVMAILARKVANTNSMLKIVLQNSLVV